MKTYQVAVVVNTQIYLQDEKGCDLDHSTLGQEGARETWTIRAPSKKKAITYARHYIHSPHIPGDNEVPKPKKKCGCIYCCGKES